MSHEPFSLILGCFGLAILAWVVSAKFWDESIGPILVGRFGHESFHPWVVSAQERGYSKCFCIDKLRIFHANQIYMCLDPHLN